MRTPELYQRLCLSTLPVSSKLLVKQALQKAATFLGRDKTIFLLQRHAELKNCFKYGDRNYFQQVFIEINGRCNRTCVYCPNVIAGQPDQYMETGRFVAILKRLQALRWSGPVAYHFLNEPTLHPRLVELVGITRGMLPKSKPVLFTNGDFLTRKLCLDLIRAGLWRATITRHPPVSSEWDSRIQSLCSEFVSVFHKETIKPSGLMNPAGVIKRYSNSWKGTCVSPKRVLIIRLSGVVSACCCDYTNETNFGNVLTTPIQDIWDSPAFVDARTRLRDGERVFAICKNCSGVA